MTKFNLDSLPKCGAKTRNGKPCKRYGNKVNGRCKLHGGRSTGAKTKEGKLAVRVNALLNEFTWYCNNRFYMKIKKSDMHNGILAYLELIELTNMKALELKDEVYKIVEQYHVELEMSKYYITMREGADALIIIQSALDHYYKDTAAQHLYFHVYTPLYPSPFFDRLEGSKAQQDKEMQILIRTAKKKGDYYTSRACPNTMRKTIKNHITAQEH